MAERAAASVATALCAAAAIACGTAPPTRSTRYEDLTALFTEWRTFQQPTIADGVPDYGVDAMAQQRRKLAAYQTRLAGIDPAGWPIDRQVDYHVVRAEMNGLDFDHRVLQPWANNPAFYVTVFPSESDQPAREGPLAYGGIDLWRYQWPLSEKDAAAMASGLHVIPALLDQARRNLTGSQHDLWTAGTSAIRQQGRDLAELLTRAADAPASLKTEIERAKAATDQLAAWLDVQAPSKTGRSGVGVSEYDWYLEHVQLVPFTWREEILLMQRELARAHSYLAMEEQRNRALPPQPIVSSPEEHTRRFNEGVTEYMTFLDAHHILEVKPWMDAAMRARIGRFNPGPREFFTEVDYRDPEVMRTHGYHWFDKGRMAHEPHASPVRRGPLLYNIFNTRTEGHATGWEELMLQAGMFDARPRARELIYIMVAERAARALGDLRMHSNEFTLDQATAFASGNTPRNWLRIDGRTARSEQHLYLQQPGYGTSYVVGKILFDRLLMTRKRELGDRFAMPAFMEEFDAAGLVPMALVEWQVTGELQPDTARMLAPR